MADTNPIKYSDLIRPDDSIEKLTAQLEALRATLAVIKGEAAQLSVVMQGVNSTTSEGRKSTQKASDDAEKLARAYRDLAFAESDTAKKIAELKQAQKEANDIAKLQVIINQSAEGSYNKLSAQYRLNKIYLNNMTTAERECSEEGRKLVEETRAIYEEMDRLQRATGKYQLNVGNYENSITNAVGINSEFGKSLISIAKGGEEAKAKLTELKGNFAALGTAAKGLLVNPAFLTLAGLAAAGQSLKWLYDYNTGLKEATRLTADLTGAHGDGLIEIRSEVQAVADTLGVEFREAMIATNALAKQFGIGMVEAAKLVQEGLIAGGNANGEYLDILREYPAYFKEAGISASQFIAIVSQTSKQGIFSDKAVDTIKEGNLRIREMTTATAAALDGIGISSKKVQEELQNGSKTTFDVMREVAEQLGKMPESASAVGTAIADIFGGPGEDAGLQFIKTLATMETDLGKVTDSTGDLGKAQHELMRAEVELNKAVAELFDFTGGGFEELEADAKSFLYNFLTKILQGVKDLEESTRLFSTAWAVAKGTAVGFFNAVATPIQQLGKAVKATSEAVKALFDRDFKRAAAEAEKAGKALLTGAEAAATSVQKSIFASVRDNFNKSKESGGADTATAAPASTGGAAKITPAGNSKKQAAAQNKAAKAQADAEKAALAALQARRRLEDAILSQMAEGYDKQRQMALTEAQRRKEDIQTQLASIEEQKKAEATKAANRQAAAIEIENIEKELTKKLEEIERERQLHELALQRETLQLRLAAVEKGSAEEIQLRARLLENQRQQELLQNKMKPEGERQSDTDINAKYTAQGQALAGQAMRAELERLDMLQDLAYSEIELLNTTEAKKTQLRLAAERDRLQKVLELAQAYGVKMSGVEVATLQNQIKGYDKKIEESKREQRGDIYGLLGLDLDDKQKEAISQSVSFATEQLSNILAAKVQAAEAAVQAANAEVESAKNAVDKEIEARNNGYANNVEMAQKELENAKKNQQKALKEQQRAQRAQQALDAATQASSLVTASAEIWKSFSGSGPWGIAAAVAAIALMWSSFLGAKIKAMQLTKQTAAETYGDGTVELLRGGSHASGHDIDLGVKPDGTRRRAEGGEYFAVINKRSSRRYGKLIPNIINSLNRGTFTGLPALSGDNLSVNVANIGGSTSQEEGQDLGRLADDVRAIRKMSEKRTYLANGEQITEYKNLTTRTRRE